MPFARQSPQSPLRDASGGPDKDEVGGENLYASRLSEVTGRLQIVKMTVDSERQSRPRVEVKDARICGFPTRKNGQIEP